MELTSFTAIAYRLIYPIQLIGSGLILLWKCKRRPKFLLAFLLCAALSLLFGAMIPMNIGIGNFSIPINSLSVLVVVFFLFLSVFEVSQVVAALVTAMSSLIQHISFCVENLIDGYWFSFLPNNIGTDVLRLILRNVVLILFLLLIELLIKKRGADIKDIGLKSKTVFVFTILTIIATNLLSHNLDRSSWIDSLLDLLSSAVLLVFIFLANDLVSKDKYLKLTLENEQKHYESLSASIELVNRRVHDFKHYVHYMKGKVKEESALEELQKMENDVSIYESLVKTGNFALDNALNEFAILAQKEDIKLLCAIDGTKLTKISPIDHYVIFGNLMDNAIREAKKHSKGHRFISLSSKEKNGVYSLSVENYCSEKIAFEDNLPISSKEDKFFHGIGLKSVRATVKKYGGAIAVTCDDNIFKVVLLFPLQVLGNNN